MDFLFSICNGLPNRKANILALKYFANKFSNKDVELAKKIVAKWQEKEGEKLKSKFYLPEIKEYEILGIEPLFEILDERAQNITQPFFRFLYNSVDGKEEKFQISFFEDKSKGFADDNQLIVKNITRKRALFFVSRDGSYKPCEGAIEFLPSLACFKGFLGDIENQIVEYGLKTGECGICGKKLKDEKSIKLGIGPVCRMQLKNSKIEEDEQK